MRQLALLLLCIAATIVAPDVQAQGSLPPGILPQGPFDGFGDPKARKGELVVTFNRTAINKVTAQLKKTSNVIKPSRRAVEGELAKILGLRTSAGMFDNAYLVKGGSINAAKLRSAIAKGLVKRAEPNYQVFAFAANDFFYQFQWGINNSNGDVDVDGPEAWEVTEGSPNVVVAVLDTGVWLKHLDLSTNLWTNPNEKAGNGVDDDGNGYVDDVQGWNFVANNNSPNDGMFHGTHCAGIIGALRNNGHGIIGVAPRTTILPIQVLDSRGSGDTANVMKAIRYVVDLKRRGVNVQVINASMGGGEFQKSFQDVLQEADEAGVLFVAAAGNESNDNDDKPTYPAGYQVPNVLSVAAVDSSGKLASFSNFGARSVHVAAPGVGIWSTFPFSFYLPFDGTSMAAPYVAGVAALVYSQSPGSSPSQVISRIRGSVKPLPDLRGKVASPGIVSAYRALRR